MQQHILRQCTKASLASQISRKCETISLVTALHCSTKGPGHADRSAEPHHLTCPSSLVAQECKVLFEWLLFMAFLSSLVLFSFDAFLQVRNASHWCKTIVDLHQCLATYLSLFCQIFWADMVVELEPGAQPALSASIDTHWHGCDRWLLEARCIFESLSRGWRGGVCFRWPRRDCNPDLTLSLSHLKWSR